MHRMLVVKFKQHATGRLARPYNSGPSAASGTAWFAATQASALWGMLGAKVSARSRMALTLSAEAPMAMVG